jgi:hypothetical protein
MLLMQHPVLCVLGLLSALSTVLFAFLEMLTLGCNGSLGRLYTKVTIIEVKSRAGLLEVLDADNHTSSDDANGTNSDSSGSNCFLRHILFSPLTNYFPYGIDWVRRNKYECFMCFCNIDYNIKMWKSQYFI